MIYVYNRTKETHEGPNNYFIGRPSILGNPYTHIKDKTTLASYVVRTRDEAIELYDHYFDVMYSGNIEYKKLIEAKLDVVMANDITGPMAVPVFHQR